MTTPSWPWWSRGWASASCPELLLKNAPYHLEVRELDPPATRQIGVACKHANTLSPAARQFLQHVKQEAGGDEC